MQALINNRISSLKNKLEKENPSLYKMVKIQEELNILKFNLKKFLG